MAFNIGDQIDYNINNQKNFFNKKKQHKSIWDDHSLLRIFVVIIIPTTTITFMSALYVFIDELLLTRLVPLSNTFENMITGAGTSCNDYIDYVDKLNNAGLDVYLTKYSRTLIVRNAITYFAPLALIIVAFSQFVFLDHHYILLRWMAKQSIIMLAKLDVQVFILYWLFMLFLQEFFLLL